MLHRFFYWMHERGQRKRSRHAFKRFSGTPLLNSASFKQASFGKYEKHQRKWVKLAMLTPLMVLGVWFIVESAANVNFFQ